MSKGNGKHPGGGQDYSRVERAGMAMLAERFEEAMGKRREGKDDEAKSLLRKLLELEPRLPEPRLELAHIAFRDNDLDDAEGHVRVAVERLREGGQWTAALPANELLAYALNFLGEILIASTQAALDGEPKVDKDAYLTAWNEAAKVFNEAHELDPRDERIAENRLRYRPIREKK